MSRLDWPGAGIKFVAMIGGLVVHRNHWGTRGGGVIIIAAGLCRLKVEKHYIFLMNVYATFGAAIPHQGVFKAVWLQYYRCGAVCV